MEKKDVLKELEEKAEELAGREKELQGQISGLKERTGGRSPTRHKVDNPIPPGNEGWATIASTNCLMSARTWCTSGISL